MPIEDVAADALVEDLDHWLKYSEVIRLRSAGLSVPEICDRLKQSQRTVYRWIAEATAAVRSENRQFADEMFLVHFHRLEALYEIVQKRIDAMAADATAPFSRDVFRAAIDILDRQSKLLGLDRSRGAKGKGDWLDGASDRDLLVEAERIGLKIPEKFKVPNGRDNPKGS